MSGPLSAVLDDLAAGVTCQAYTRVDNGRPTGKICGPASAVTLVCEHEHIFDAVLCDEHREDLPTVGRCPLCWHLSGDDRHCCRMCEVPVAAGRVEPDTGEQR